MAQTVHALTCHMDATRFEIEDVLVRQAAASLVSEATALETIIADVGIHLRSTPGTNASDLASVNALLWLTSENEADTRPPELDALVAEAAVVTHSWLVTTNEISELSKPWVGQATPGPKVSIVFKRTTPDSPDYRTRLVELAGEVRDLLGDVGSRTAFADDDSCPFDAAIIYWFPSPEAAEQAFESNGFDRVITSSLVDRGSAVVLEMIEHRIKPNPNNWNTTTGIQPPSSGPRPS